MPEHFEPAGLYSRETVAALIGKPLGEKGGSWYTGYDEWNGEGFVFTNVGTAGRTGHDYSNQWVGNRLEWSGKTGSRRGQPQIDRIVSNSMPVHIFWRRADRAPFSYAGVGTALEATDGAPVRVLWGFDGPSIRTSTNGAKRPKADAWRRGPPPLVRSVTSEREDGPTAVYLVRLEGLVSGLMDVPKGHWAIKVGMTNCIDRRLAELNYGFPPGSKANWSFVRSNLKSSAGKAWELEGNILKELQRQGHWIGGEYAVVPKDVGETLLR